MVQSVVAFNLKVNLANRVLGFAGRGNVPKFQTIDPVAPNVGSKVTVLGEGSGVNNMVPTALPGTYVALKGIGIINL